ncbi:hypothetical protein GS500_22670, partial [Rhodococcus hoagii]|nr:hypothetical protein [Prescottella equi]
MLWGIAFDLMDIPLKLVAPGDVRGPLDPWPSRRSGATYLFGTALITALTLPVRHVWAGAPRGWQTYVIAIAIISFALTTIAARGVRER